MPNTDIPRLCGGTVFTLILEARKQRYGVREHFHGDSDGLSEMDTLIGLAGVMKPDLKRPAKQREDTVQGNTTEFKICKTAGGTAYYPFSNRQSKKAFDERVKNSYSEALGAMADFVSNFLVKHGKDKEDINLVKALLDLIDKDTSITDTQLFYIRADGIPATKAEIKKLTKVCFESFLLGVWHYALLRKEGNCIGKNTMKEWCPSRGGAPREYQGTMGDDLDRDVKVDYLSEMNGSDNDSDVTIKADTNTAESEIIDSVHETDTQPAQQKLEQNINKPRVFSIHMEQSGSGEQIAYVENYYGKGDGNKKHG